MCRSSCEFDCHSGDELFLYFRHFGNRTQHDVKFFHYYTTQTDTIKKIELFMSDKTMHVACQKSMPRLSSRLELVHIMLVFNRVA